MIDEIFEDGERTGIKMNPDTIAKAMRRARNENNERVFQVSDFDISTSGLLLQHKKICKPQKTTLLRRLFVPHV